MTIKITRKLIRTKIQWGILSYSTMTKKDFYDKLPNVFDVICGSIRLENRHAGKYKIWLTIHIMRQFRIGQILTLEIKNKRKLHMAAISNQDLSATREFIPF